MSMWGRDAIEVLNRPTPRHRFKFNVIGAGKRHRNASASYRRFIIRLEAGTYFREAAATSMPLLTDWTHADCLVDTGATRSIFCGDVADKLKLKVENPFDRALIHVAGPSKPHLWCEHVLALAIGPAWIPVRIWFPVRRVRIGSGSRWEYRWRTGFPRTNILGMTDVLNRLMLCFTPQTLFAFARK